MVLGRLSTGYSPVTGRLHTCYSPVRRSPPKYCYLALPLDLHVLSLSLAFILSQDQTLRCKSFFYFFFLSSRVVSLSIDGLVLPIYFFLVLLNCISITQRSFSVSLSFYQLLLVSKFSSGFTRLLYVWKAGAKVEAFSIPSKLFTKKISYFLQSFWQKAEKAEIRERKKFLFFCE